MEMDGRNVQSEIEEDHTVIVDVKDNEQDTPQLKRAMKNKLQKVSIISEHRCIYRVPKHLRDTNEAAYVPRLVSLGPFHHGNENLKAMEEHKWRCCNSFIEKHDIDLGALLGLMKENEEKTRKCYDDRFELPSDEFVQVIIVDAIFVINSLLQFHSSDSAVAAVNVGSIYHEAFFWCQILRDMMLLENQLPLFILDEILPFVKRTEGSSIAKLRSVIELSVFLFNFHMKEGTDHKSDSKDLNRNPSKKEEEDLNRYKSARHFVDFQRLYYMPVEALQKERLEGKFEKVESISKLHKLGVRFEVASAKTFLDVKFEDGVLKIPGIVVSDSTETIFRNLLAYDQCHNGFSHISDYFVLMGMLIDTAEDVELLVKNNILQNDLDTEQEVSKVFNNLEKELIYQVSFYYSRQCKQINEYCKDHRHWWMATLKQKYLDTPWKIISVTAASVLLVLTFIITVCSVISLSASVVYLCNTSLGEYLAALRKLPLITK